MSKKIQHHLEYLLFRFVQTAIRILPEFTIAPFAQFIAFLGFKVIQYRREVALENLANAFPEKSPAERFSIAYRSYRHFALLILEFMKLSSWSLDKLEKKITLERPENFEEFLQDTKGEGIIFVSGHFGNWEMAIALIAARYFSGTSVIQQRQQNPLVDKHITDLRRRWGMEIIHSRGAVKKGLAALQKKHLVGLLCDQDGGKRGVFVPFMGQTASTPVGAALLHLRSKAKLFFACSVCTGRYSYQGVILPVEYRGDFAVTDENIKKITAAFTAILEKHIRQYPEQYLWMHKRWKTKYTPEAKARQVAGGRGQ